MKFRAETLPTCTKPPSDTEENRLSNAERMEREAIKNEDISPSLQLFP